MSATRLRRATLGTLLTLSLVATLLVGPPPPARGQVPDASVATRGVAWPATAFAAASTGDVWHEAAPLPAGDVVLVGAAWSGDAEVQLRSRHRDGWTPWVEVQRDAEEEGPDPDTDEARRQDASVSRPVWVGRASAVQVRALGTPPRDLVLHEVSMSGGDLDWLPRPALSAAHAAPARPAVVPRSSWDPKGECRPRSAPSYAHDVRFSYVHHTVTTNDYGPAAGPAQVLAICLFHRNSRGWDDVGYNFLVDRHGNAYEGRAGGITEAVVGAHASGFNSGSTGVSMIGTFTSASPPAAALDALRRLLAWKLDVHHVDPLGETVEMSGGGSTNRFPEDRVITLPTIVGHRDTGHTSCPGDALYPYVHGRLREDVAALQGRATYGGLPPRVEQAVTGPRPRFDATFSSAADWRLTIADATGALVRSTGGRGAEGVALRWDLRDRTGAEVPPGTYTASLEQVGSDASPVETTVEVTPAVERRAGAHRVATAVALSRWAFDDPRRTAAGFPQSGRVVVASSEAFPDALVATPLAGSYGAPILLTPKGRLPQVVAEEIRRLGAEHAIVVGGTARISTQVEADLRSAGVREVERLAGPDRYATAGKVAWRVVEREGPKEALVALGTHPVPSRAFQDALVAGAFGGAFDLPVLLVRPDDVTPPTKWVLERRDWIRGVSVVGGRGVISAGVKRALGAYVERTVREFAGGDAYATSAIVAEELLARRAAEPDDPQRVDRGIEVVLATGENWPDALGAGAAAVRRGASFLLVHASSLGASQPTADWLTAHRSSTVHAVAAGGPAAVADGVLRDIEAIVRSAGPHTAPREEWPPDPWAPAGIALPPDGSGG